jgi:sucrose-6-phosphate hydrolase SacC (GH32 family)
MSKNNENDPETNEQLSEPLRLTRRDLLKTTGVAAAGAAGVGGQVARARAATPVADADSQPYRPNFHFAPSSGWMNDPNGLVYHDGEYHLFYQAGEDERRWDHAVSDDLLTWTELGTALPVEDGIEQWSGGGVVDANDTAGFGAESLVFHYTGEHQGEPRQDQRLAYSTDDGRTVTKYDANPVLPADGDAFRDPNVFWYDPDGSWRMVVGRVAAEPENERPKGVEIYSSSDLKNWTYESTYQASGDVGYETPDLFELPVEGTSETRWVLSVSVDYSTVEYHVGDFDGTAFTAESVVRADDGYDYYAPMTWSNEPDGRRVQVAWMNHWEYATDLPDNGWQGAQTVPRAVELVDDGGSVDVRQSPVSELTDLRRSELANLRSEPITSSDDPLDGTGVAGRRLELDATIDPGDADAVELRVREDGNGQETLLSYDSVNETLTVDRSNSGAFFGSGSYDTPSMDLPARSDGTVRLRVLVDRSSVEVFANGGAATMTNLVFPDWTSTDVSLTAANGTATLEEFVAYELEARKDWAIPGSVNAGGDVYSTRDGTTFRYDQFYDNGSAFSVSDSIDRTRDDRLYRTERVDDPLTYNVDLADGTYDLVLHFAENYFTASGDRVFDVLVQGETVLSDFDIYDEVGHDAAVRKPVQDVVVNGDSLTIECPASVDAGKLSAVEVTSSGDINVGGDFYTATDDTTYGPDRYYSGGATYSTSDAISGTDDDALYQTERAQETLTYDLPVGNGTYDVDLHFAEIYYSSSGERVFDVSVQGETVLTDFDIYDRVGHDAALVETIEDVTVTDGVLTITADASVDAAKISAVTVRRLDGAGVLSFAEGRKSSTAEAVGGVRNPVSRRDDEHPIWLGEPGDASLLLDGYSTAADWNPTELDERLDRELSALTIDAWVAPRSTGAGNDNLDTIVEKALRGSNAGFAFGALDHRQWGLKLGDGSSWETVKADSSTGGLLNMYEWTHLAAVFDGDAGTVSLYKDGSLVTEQSVGATSIVPADNHLRVGRNYDTEVLKSVFETDHFNGAIDALELRPAALSGGEIADKYDAELGDRPAVGYEDLLVNPRQFDGDNFRPQYHVIPPEHWMNEPHGPLYYDGRYHLFYQHNPKGPYWNYIHWGHWVSDDLVYWEPVEDALRPESGIDAGGCWTGDSAIDPNGDPKLFYTAGDADFTQRVAEATPTDVTDPDLTDWDKQGVVMEQPDDPDLLDNEFRDPHVWQEDGEWFCLVGSGLKDGQGGTALVFHSTDCQNWSYEGRLYELPDPSNHPELGEVWELPVLLPLGTDSNGDEKHIFCINPHAGDADVEVWYWIGEWDRANREFVPDFEDPKLIDEGDGHFTGPSGLIGPNGRSILFTITQDYRLPELRHASGFAHNGGTPVELSLDGNDRLNVAPIQEMEKLRTDKLLEMRDADPALVNDALEGLEADTVELSLEIEPGDATEYGFFCRQTPDRDEETLVYYDEEQYDGEIRTDRTNTSLDDDLMQKEKERSSLTTSGPVAVDHTSENLRFRAFLDKSSIECYVNDLKSVSTRAFPSRDDAHELQVYHNGSVTVTSIEVWAMDDIATGPDGSAGLEDGATYRIQSASSGKVVEVENGSTSDGANVQQYEWTGADRQKWVAREVSAGIYRFENVNSGKVLDVQDAGTANGDTVMQWDWWGGDNQQWTVDPVNDVEPQVHRVRNVNSGKVLDLEDDAQTDGGDVQQWEWLDGDNQHWRFERL